MEWLNGLPKAVKVIGGIVIVVVMCGLYLFYASDADGFCPSSGGCS